MVLDTKGLTQEDIDRIKALKTLQVEVKELEEQRRLKMQDVEMIETALAPKREELFKLMRELGTL